jgi:hypothetical protein
MKVFTAIILAISSGLVAPAGAEYFLLGDKATTINMPYCGGAGYNAVRCQSLARVTDGLVAGDIRRWEWFSAETGTSGKFYKFRIYLCHTNRFDLAPPFAGNYDGRTPALVYAADPVTVDMSKRDWFGFDVNPSFAYNGSDNLLVEVRWEGDDDKGGSVFTADVPHQHRCLFAALRQSGNVNGYPDGGAPYTWLHYMRVELTPSAVEPTSLGRVRAIYR